MAAIVEVPAEPGVMAAFREEAAAAAVAELLEVLAVMAQEGKCGFSLGNFAFHG